MLIKIFISLLGLTLGAATALFVNSPVDQPRKLNAVTNPEQTKKSVIGFLPFWLIDEAKGDYSDYLNEITYFNLTIGEDGHIRKYLKPNELEPGYNALYKNRFSPQGLISSLALFLGEDESIENLLENPVESADNLSLDVNDVINDFGFEKINIDIEKVGDSSTEERLKFIELIKEIRSSLDKDIKISIDVTASSFVKETNLVNVKGIEPYVDQIIIMAYDYHHPASIVTGPIAPLMGSGTISEYDVEIAVKNALIVVPKEKLILGVPLYGYSWETLNESTRSATIPRTFITYSNKKAESLNGTFDETDKEMYSVIRDHLTNTYRQTYYPNFQSMEEKVSLAEKFDLGGVALWALGYEGETILEPLLNYYH